MSNREKIESCFYWASLFLFVAIALLIGAIAIPTHWLKWQFSKIGIPIIQYWRGFHETPPANDYQE